MSMRTVNRELIKKSFLDLYLSTTRHGARWLRKSRMPLAILFITMAIVFSVFRALTPWAKQYKGDVEKHLSLLIGQPVIINSMETSWYWFEPVLKLNQVTVQDNQDHSLKFAKLLVGIDLLSSLWHWHIQPGILYIDDVHLTVRQINNHWQMDGLRQDHQMTTLEADAYWPVLGWILGQQKIILKYVSAMVHLKDGTLLPLSALNLTAIHHNGHYRLKGEATLSQTMATELLFLADLKLNPSELNKVSGRAYLSVRHFLPQQWQTFLPKASYHLDGGKGDLEVWLDVLKGRVSNAQTKLNFHRIEWSQDGHPHAQFIQSLRANVAWGLTKGGWQLSADQIKLRADGVRWPENSLLVTYQQAQNTYRMFLKNLLLEPLLARDIDWPEVMQPLLGAHPTGQLHDTQVEMQMDGAEPLQLNYVLTGFSDLGWQEQAGYPAVSHLSGVLRWKPKEGRLELDGENTGIVPHGLPPVTFIEANAAFEWKESVDGLRVSMGRLVLNHPDFLFSARGDIDNPLLPDVRNLRLTAEFSGEHAQQWLRYIPSDHLKPELAIWLKHDIKRIDKASGQLVVKGPLVDFPFDVKPGEFTVTSRLSGVSLFFHEQWPPIDDIDLNLTADKRTLTLDVLHASLSGIETDKANLRIDDIGLGRESLLLHGQMNPSANKLKAYVFSTPLRTYFSRLKKLDMKGTVGLDLNLEVPLYPENDEVLVRGALTFDHNQAIFHHALKDVQWSQLSGTLQFDDQGVANSDLSAALFGEPVTMHIQRVLQPKPYTQMTIDGETTIDTLRHQFDLPIFSSMRGHLDVSSKITWADDPKAVDHMQVSTSLEGVSIDLPKPLGKQSSDRAPLTVAIDFNHETAVRLRLDYDERMSIKASRLDNKVWSVQLDEQDVAGDLRYDDSSNTLSGRLSRLYLAKSVFARKQNNEPVLSLQPKNIPNLNLTMDVLKVGELNLGDATLKSNSTKTHWHLDECKISSPNYLLTLKGDWERNDLVDNTQLQADLQVTDLSKSLKLFDITPVIEGHKGGVQFDGAWPGAVNDFALSKVTGDFYMNFENGRIINLSKETEEKLGLGKLLSILSLQTIPRRLKLDFSDLSNTGYSFDVLKGHFALKDGIMNTTDSYIDGPVAYANMKGDLDVVKHLYDIRVHISPHITASLPIVATIAGGPIAGMATWAASKIINQGMQQVTGYTYHVSGPWLNPVVEQVSIYKNKVDARSAPPSSMTKVGTNGRGSDRSNVF